MPTRGGRDDHCVAVRPAPPDALPSWPVLLTRSRTVMGPLANRPPTTVAASLIAALVSVLNFYLIGQVLLI